MKQVMYLGPDIRGLVRKNQIFTYYPEDVIRRACEMNRLARHLFVSMENIVQKKEELRREGSFLNLVYKKIEKEEEKHGRLQAWN